MSELVHTSSREDLPLDRRIPDISFIGLSGVGKTRATKKLQSIDSSPRVFSIDEAIWTQPSLLLEEFEHWARRSNIDISQVAANNLSVTAEFLGMLGDPRQGGISEETFRHRMALHAQAELAAIQQVPYEVGKAETSIIDLSGSFCEVVEPGGSVVDSVAMATLPVYIEASDEHIEKLRLKNLQSPKPLYYRPEFLDEQLPLIYERYGVRSSEDLEPAVIARELFPELIRQRQIRYTSILGSMGMRALTIPIDEMRASEPDELYIRLASHARVA